jgi:hypothetical protein
VRIGNLGRSANGPHARLSATVTWEESNREPVDVHYDVPAEFADRLVPSANAFLMAGVFPATAAGERRVSVDGEVCPRLLSGLRTALALFDMWYGTAGADVVIEAPIAKTAQRSGTPARAGAFFTGGIDSLTTLRRNRLTFAPSHPEYIQDGVLLYGINFDSDDRLETFADAVKELSAVTRSIGAELVPVFTNARRVLNADIDFFRYKYHGALLAAAAHILDGRLTTMSIGSSHDYRHLMPWGSHPLLDGNFGSTHMRLYHDSQELSRFAKTQVVAGWEAGLQNIKVCVTNWPGKNCGVCEKCRRTMLALIALNALDRCDAFAVRDLDPDAIRSIHVASDSQSSFYVELVAPLRRAGREDLARAVEFILKRYRGELGWLGGLKLADRRYFGGGLSTMKRRFGGTTSTLVA